MSSSSGSGRLSDAESADLSARVERFRAGWAADGSTDLSASLPPPGAPHRRAVLIQIIRTDMERRAEAKLPFRAERYVGMFPDDLTSNTVPAELLADEYLLRHLHTDRPPLSEYERWFPDQYPAMLEELRRAGPGAPGLNPTVPASVKPVVPTRRSGSQTPIVPSGDVLPSDTPYHLVRKLGEGAFGEVYEARAPGGVRVAVKRILRNVDHPASVAEHEALESIKNLSHPFLLKTNAYWVFDDRLVIVMELADGSLADRIQYHTLQGRTGVPPEELIPLFEQAGEALDYLHSESVSHRDIKPENILVLRGYAKVADFGLVRAHEHTMTNVGGTAGTPAYMAPEMWQQKVSLQSDQYSLAATYVRCRLGHHLYQTSILIDLANSHVNGTPDLSPLPDAEQRVLLRALAKNPDHRYESCAAFAKALRAAVFPPPEPPKPGAVERERDRRPTNPLVTAISVAVAVAVAVAAVMAFFMPKTPPSDAGKAPDPAPPKVEKPLVSVANWSADPGAGERAIGEKRYPLRLTREVGEDTLAALLIYPTDDSDPSLPFYMLETKISNRVFAHAWELVSLDPDADMKKWDEEQRAALILKAWEQGAVDQSKNTDPPTRLGITGDQADVPVLGVTVPEAILVANKLGGALPKFRQWVKATGALEKGDDRKLPAGQPRNKTFTDDTWLAELRRRDLGLGLARPLPVTAGKDVSVKWKIRQLVSNGPEWIGEAKPNDGERIQLVPPPQVSDQAGHVGQSYHHTIVMDHAAIANWGPLSITTTKPGTGFRIVLEPR